MNRSSAAFLVLVGILTATRVPGQLPVNTERAEVGTAFWRGMPIHYVIKNGLPIYQGDIILDHLGFGTQVSVHSSLREQDPADRGRTGAVPDELPRTLGVIYPSSLWPAVNGIHRIPYVMPTASPTMNAAIAEYNRVFAGLIEWVPAQTNDTDYVSIDLTPAGPSGEGSSGIVTSEGFSNVGRVGGQQQLNCLTTCPVATILHEMGHTTGLWHEQSRPDRDTYVTLDSNHIQAELFAQDAFAIINATDNASNKQDNAWIYGPYDYASIMQYSNFYFSADGFPTIQSVPPGIPLSNPGFFTSEDIDTIRRLYGAAPADVTIDTNPTGLQVIVDGATITTPRTYTNWGLNSPHTLDIPAGISNSGLQGPQRAGNPTTLYYQFNQWNDGGVAGHRIVIAPGNGTPGFPSTSPAQTVYTANFIQWDPFVPGPNADPPGAGILTTVPAPTTFAGVGQFFMAYQNVTLTANASPGYQFMQWNGGFSCTNCAASKFANPLNLYYLTTENLHGGFTKSQITTVTTNPPGLPVQVDGATYISPVSFSPDPIVNGSAWAAGTMHTVNAQSPLNPWSPNTVYIWSNWSDGLAAGHTITVPSGNSTVTANYSRQLGLVTPTNSPGDCTGSVTANPSGPYTPGTSVTLDAIPAPGFLFAQWEGALSGPGNPSTGPVNREEYIQADFNTVPAPLTITSLSPVSVPAGAGSFTLTIDGAGFDQVNGGVFVGSNHLFRTATSFAATQIQIPILAADVANPGALEILVENFNASGSCWVAAVMPLLISAPLATPLTTSSPALLQIGIEQPGSFRQGESGATYSATVSNKGGSPTAGTVTVVETLPEGLTLVSIKGAGWSCNINTCTRNDALTAGGSYPPITVTVSVASNSPSQLINQVSVSGGGSAAGDSSYLTIVAPRHPRVL